MKEKEDLFQVIAIPSLMLLMLMVTNFLRLEIHGDILNGKEIGVISQTSGHQNSRRNCNLLTRMTAASGCACKISLSSLIQYIFA
jgi:hypothetical protein